MTKERRDGLVLLLLGAVMFLVIGIAWKHLSPIANGDFKVVYLSARCLLRHGDPYSQVDVSRVYLGELAEHSSDTATSRQVMTRYFYPPTAFIVTVPFALIGFEAGHVLWTILSASLLIVAAVLMWDLAADDAPRISGALLGLFLMNSFWLFMIGNSAGIVVSLCVIAVWCFLKDRCITVGISCLAISLALKPHDSGMVWLFFLLAGGAFRKRALQSLIVLVALSVPAVLWVTHAGPHWIKEMNANMSSFSGVGGITDPAATGTAGRNMDSLVQLQSAVSIFWDDPQIYNWITYVICGALILVWVFATLRFPPSKPRTWLALAVIAPLSMLPTYHMQHDAKLLLLAVPACAMMWASGGKPGKLAIVVTGAAIVINGDIFSALRITLTHRFIVPQPHLLSEALTVLLTRPAPLILLVTAGFYLWIYVRYPLSSAVETQSEIGTPSPI